MLRRAVELGVNFIDTADSYGPFVSEQLIDEALHPYPEDLVIATKAGLTRPGPGVWRAGRPPGVPAPAGRAEPAPPRRRARSTCSSCTASTRRCPLEDQLGELAALQDEGKIRHIGLSEVVGRAARGRPADRRRSSSVQNLLQPGRPRGRATCSTTATDEGIALHPVVPARHRRAGRGRAARSPRSPPTTAPRPPSSRWPGCCTARRSCCRSPARPVGRAPRGQRRRRRASH